MTPRVPLIAGNWKMHKTGSESARLIAALRRQLLPDGVEVAVCPPFTALYEASAALQGSRIRLGAQDVYWEASGAFTGEISPLMLADLNCHYVIIGHSERRQYFGETDGTVARKVQAAYAHSLVPIACVGERLDQREAGQAEAVVTRQVEAAFTELTAGQIGRLVIAYEPVWAIGTGRSASGEEANRIIGIIRGALAARFGDAASETRILYGGSVTPDNAAEFSRVSEIDGALVGGASLDPDKFAAIVRASAP